MQEASGDDKRYNLLAFGRGKKKMPTDANGQTGSNGDWQAGKRPTSALGWWNWRKGKGGGEEKWAQCVCCSQRRRYVRYKTVTVRPSFLSAPPNTPYLSTFNAAPHSISSSPFTAPNSQDNNQPFFFLLAVVPLRLSCHSVNTPYRRSFRKP